MPENHKPTLRAPRHLTKATQAWWVSVTQKWELETHHTMVLQAACESWDELQAARRQIKAEGLTIRTASGGSKPNPAVAIARHARTSFLRCVRELDLDTQPAPDAKRPPALRSIAR